MKVQIEGMIGIRWTARV